MRDGHRCAQRGSTSLTHFQNSPSSIIHVSFLLFTAHALADDHKKRTPDEAGRIFIDLLPATVVLRLCLPIDCWYIIPFYYRHKVPLYHSHSELFFDV